MELSKVGCTPTFRPCLRHGIGGRMKKNISSCEVLINYIAWAIKYLEQVPGLTIQEVETIEKKLDILKNEIQYKKMII